MNPRAFEDGDLEVSAPGDRIGDYVVQRILGQGGMAIVYLVHHPGRKTFHALKRLVVPGRDVRDRLVREGRVQATLQHPNVVAVSEILDLPGGPGLVMEYVAGPTLTAAFLHHRLAPQQREVLARGILRGVAAAHARGLVHRDLKPDNVLLAIEGDQVVPKIMDFGLAKQLATRGATRAGSTMGTPAYMAPEQIQDAASVDQRADVFSLGSMMYEVVSGKVAFPGQNAVEVWRAVAKGQYTRLDSGLAPRRQLEAIYRALSPKPADRFADAGEMLQAWCRDLRDEDLASGADLWPEEVRALLAAHGPGAPVLAAPPPTERSASRLWVWVALGVVAMGSAGLLALGLLVLGAALFGLAG